MTKSKKASPDDTSEQFIIFSELSVWEYVCRYDAELCDVHPKPGKRRKAFGELLHKTKPKPKKTNRSLL